MSTNPNNDWSNNYQTFEKEEREEMHKSNLLWLYNIIDWIDFGLVFAIIFYVGRTFRAVGFPFEYLIENIAQNAGLIFIEFPPSVVGLLLCVASLVVSISAIIVSRLIHRSGAHRSRLRLIGRYIMWGIWIPIDIYFLVVYAIGLIG